jgi:DNA polymerase II small subunit/DNA polymerase delta subunit B
MSAHDPRIASNPAVVTLEGVSVLMYHGVSLDEVIAELPEEKASYDDPHKAMYQLLRKRHVGPQFGGRRCVGAKAGRHSDSGRRSREVTAALSARTVA